MLKLLVLLLLVMSVFVCGCATISPRLQPGSQLINAAASGDVNAVTHLLQNNYSISEKAKATALLTSVSKIWMRKLVCDDNPFGSCELTGISVSLRKSYVHIVELLLNAGANPNLLRYSGYRSAMQYSRQSGNQSVNLTFAGSAGQIVDAKKGGTSVITVARNEGIHEIVDMLLQFGARPQKKYVENNLTCEEECERLFNQGALKEGVTAEDCIQASCK